MLMGLIPAFGDFLSTMPVTIGNAVLFVAYLQLFGTAYNSLNGTMFTSYTIFRLAGPVLFGVSLMNTPPALFTSLPVLFQPFLTNGLIMGVLMSIVLERSLNWDKLDKVYSEMCIGNFCTLYINTPISNTKEKEMGDDEHEKNAIYYYNLYDWFPNNTRQCRSI